MSRGGMRAGAGRPGWKQRAEDLRSVDVCRLAREGLLRPGTSAVWTWRREGEMVASIRTVVSEEGTTLIYRTRSGSGPWCNVRQLLRYDTTPGRFGGERKWWCCPRCGRRCAVVFLGVAPGCGKCLNVAYGSQSDDAIGRIWRRQTKLEQRMAGGDARWTGERPKGMHRSTFERLRHKAIELDRQRERLVELMAARMFFGSA